MKKVIVFTWLLLISLSGISQNLKIQVENAKKIYIVRCTTPEEIFYESGKDAYAKPILKKIGEWPKELFTAFDDSLMARCNKLFGEGKVEWWPAQFIMAKPDLMGRVEDEKNVDCDFYVLNTYKPANVGMFEGKQGIIFYSKGKHSLELCQKTQAGKKGKKVASGTNFLAQTGKNIYIGSAPKPADLTAGTLEDAQKLATQKMIDEFPAEATKAIDDLFKDIEKEMKK